jgi:hypothetical protein
VLGALVRGARQLSNGYMRSVSNRKVNSAAVTSSMRGSTKKSHHSTDVTGPLTARTIHTNAAQRTTTATRQDTLA